MILYELALETGERSADLAARARTLGLTDATTSTELSAPQVAALRSGLPMPPAPAKPGAPGPPPGAAPAGDVPAAAPVTPNPVRWGGGADAPATGAVSPPTAWLEEYARANAAPPSSPPSSGGSDDAPVSSLAPPPGRGTAPGPGGPKQPRPPAGPPQGQWPGAAQPTASSSSSAGKTIGLVIGGLVGGLALIAVVSIAAVTFLGTKAEPEARQIDQQSSTPGSEPAAAQAPIERCNNLESDPEGDRLVAVCAALTPPGTPRSAAAAAALTGGLDSYTSPAPEQFCPASAKVIELAASSVDWPAKRDRLLAQKDLLAIALVKAVETSPPRWLVEIDTYAGTVRTQLAALQPDSPESAWAPVTERDASTDAPASEGLETAASLSCPT